MSKNWINGYKTVLGIGDLYSNSKRLTQKESGHKNYWNNKILFQAH